MRVLIRLGWVKTYAKPLFFTVFSRLVEIYKKGDNLFMKKGLFFSILATVLLLFSILIGYKLGLDGLQKLYSAIGSLSILLALASYWYKKDQDTIIAAIEQVSFFRKEIIPEYDELTKFIKYRNKNYLFTRIELDESTIDFIKKKSPKESLAQINVSIQPNNEVLDKQIILFNILEELALKIIHFKTQEHEALNSIKSSFVQIIEQNAAALLFEKDIVNGNNIYSQTLFIYNLWKDEIDRTSIDDRVKKFTTQ